MEGGHRLSDEDEDGDEFEHTRTENLIDFMEQAQPARGMLDSQGVSQNANSSSAYPGGRRLNGADIGMRGGRHDGAAEDKEGGRVPQGMVGPP